MRFKRFLSSALAAALLAGLMTVAAPAASAAGLSAFADLTDPKVAECAEFLRLLKVVNGVPGGNYNPGGTLSRAEFCKMAVVALDKADEESAQRGRTIYLDVGPTHWARGYINLASTITLGASSGGKGGTVLVSGVGDGTFRPDRPITYGEAVTILCRVLGYGTGDVSSGGAWYDGYLAAGAQAGLTDGLSLSGTDVITRGQAAILFYNLYFSNPKGSDDTYLESQGGTIQEGHILLDTDATAADGTTGSVETTKDIYKTDRVFDPALEGKEGKVILDSDEKLLAFQVKEGVTDKVVNLTSAEATYLMASGGEKLTVEPDALVYKDGKASTWKAVYMDLTSSTTVTFHYGANGKLAYLFIPAESADGPTTMVARTVPAAGSNPFASMAGGGTYTMFKNGVAATAADIRQYDVATYDSRTRVIQVSDLKLTGIYENADPSPAAPITVTVMGHPFEVLSSARNDLSAFKVGDRITLLLTVDGRVAGVVSGSTVKGTAVGIATLGSDSSDTPSKGAKKAISGTAVTVKLLQGGLTISGVVSNNNPERYDNQLVTVSSSSAGYLSLSLVTGSNAKGNFDVPARKVGDKELAENVVIYDRAKNSSLTAVSYDSLTLRSVSRDKISFVDYDYAGRVRYLVLDDVTGDTYQYGYFVSRIDTRSVQGATDGSTYDIQMLAVRQTDDTLSTEGSYSGAVKQNVPGGISIAPVTGGSGDIAYKVASVVTLTPLKNVSRSAFDSEDMTVTVAGISYPVAENVQCYNKTAKTWFSSGKKGMEAARAYSDSLTLYFDRPADEGGKIRLIEVP